MSGPTRATSPRPAPREEALLVLADGSVFEGEAVGGSPSSGVATGELVFNTVMSGYQEVMTDPSYAGQVIAFTYPHIGNYGVTSEDDESPRPWCRGVVLRDLAPRPSNWRSEEPLEAFLARHGVPAITGVDTRRLTRHIRVAGSMPCALGTADEATLLAHAKAEPGTEGLDLVSDVTTPEPYRLGSGRRHVVVYDFGVKSAMLSQLARLAEVEVVPATTSADAVLSTTPDGVLLSNGPGDPAPLSFAISNVADLLGRVPIFGICLGLQLLASALGGSTFKLDFGHHGGNHPVRRLSNGSVEITSQNHNYAVANGSVAQAHLTHVNLNDGVVEGLGVPKAKAFGVQYHPEAGPGPHDARYLFDDFERLMAAGR
ncbi:MAG: glutamine-hydrolyzing carbamoyl-phosphate synthase small subunit [Acidimicrobiales bacterium]